MNMDSVVLHGKTPLKEKVFSSLHTHTIFCDGKDDIETMCRAAFEKKLCAIGFSSHAPIFKKTGIKTAWHMSDDKLDEYVSEVLAARRRWQGKLEVLLGLEVDYIKGLCSPLDSDFKALNLDYIIGAVHYVVPNNGAEPFTVDGPIEEFEKGLNEGFNGDSERFMHSYYDAVAEMLSLGGFNILGHADIIKKNCRLKKPWPQEIENVRQKEIAKAAAEAKVAVEVNTGGLNRKKTSEVYPSESFLRFFKENNVPAIITADAHCADHINGNYDAALQTLISTGYTEQSTFLNSTFLNSRI